MDYGTTKVTQNLQNVEVEHYVEEEEEEEEEEQEEEQEEERTNERFLIAESLCEPTLWRSSTNSVTFSAGKELKAIPL